MEEETKDKPAQAPNCFFLDSLFCDRLARSSYRRGRHPEARGLLGQSSGHCMFTHCLPRKAKGRCLGFRCTAPASILENYL